MTQHPTHPRRRLALALLPLLLAATPASAAAAGFGPINVGVNGELGFACAKPGASAQVTVTSLPSPGDVTPPGTARPYELAAWILTPSSPNLSVTQQPSQRGELPYATGTTATATLRVPDTKIRRDLPTSAVFSALSPGQSIHMVVPGAARPLTGLYVDIDRQTLFTVPFHSTPRDGISGVVSAEGFGSSVVWLHARRAGSSSFSTVRLGTSIRSFETTTRGVGYDSIACGWVQSQGLGGGRRLFSKPGRYTVVVNASKRSFRAAATATRTLVVTSDL